MVEQAKSHPRQKHQKPQSRFYYTQPTDKPATDQIP